MVNNMIANLEEKLTALRAQQRKMVPRLCRMIDGARGSQKERRYRHVSRKIARLLAEEERIERAIRAAMSAEQTRPAE